MNERGKRLQKHCRRVEALIREGLKQASESKLPAFEELKPQIIEWLDHNELGLALQDCEGLVDALGQESLPCWLFGQARFEIASFEAGEISEVDCRLDLGGVVDWSTFHSACFQQLHFPHFYGHNMDAWIDCVEDYAISAVGGGRLILHPCDWERLSREFSEAFLAMLDCLHFINTVRRAAKICLDLTSSPKSMKS